MQRLHGNQARAWLGTLPDAIETLLRQYQLIPKVQFDSYEAIVLEASAPGLGAVVAKFAFPFQCAASIGASKAFSQHGGVPVIAADANQGFLLMSKIEPGHTLLLDFQRREDDRATELAANTIRRLRTAVPPIAGPFRKVDDDAETFAKWQRDDESLAKSFPLSWIDRAESMLADLLADDTEIVLLHGDLHHENIVVDADDRAYVIDPKGRLGDPAYEIGAWMRNPRDLWEVADPLPRLSRRMDIFCDVLGDDRERLQAWSFVQMCLAAMWLYEDDRKIWPRALEFAELLLRA